MNKDFLYYYNLELEHIRRMCGEYASKYPKISGRLGMDEFGCSDPYVERLIQGFSFLTGRLQQDLDAGYPKLSRGILNKLFPDFLLPVPPLAIAKIEPDYLNIDSKGSIVPKGKVMDADLGSGTQMRLATGHEVRLWPLKLTNAEYLTDDMIYTDIGNGLSAKSCIMLNLEIVGDTSFGNLNLDRIDFYINHSSPILTLKIYEFLLSKCSNIIIRGADKKEYKSQTIITITNNEFITPKGFELKDALYNYSDKMFEGFRVIQKFLFIYKSLLFVELKGIRNAINSVNGKRVEIIFLLDEVADELKSGLSKDVFQMYATPVVNLFEKKIEIVSTENSSSEFELSSLMDLQENMEIIKISQLNGIMARTGEKVNIENLYPDSGGIGLTDKNKYFFSVNRAQENSIGTKRNTASDAKITVSIVDKDGMPLSLALNEIEITAICCNRLSDSDGIDFLNSKINIDTLSTISQAKLLTKPTKIYSKHLFQSLWKVINNISMNWMNFHDEASIKTTEIFKTIFGMYLVEGDTTNAVNSIAKILHKPMSHRMKTDNGYVFVDGVTVEVHFKEVDDTNTQFLLGLVIDNFFKFAEPENSVVRTIIKKERIGTWVKWPVRKGQFPLI